MNELTKIIFEKLGVKPNERFYIGIYPMPYCITEYLNILSLRIDENNTTLTFGPGPRSIAELILFPELIRKIPKKPVLTADEKVILRNINKDFKYIARDSDTDLYIYNNKPIKMTTCWNTEGGVFCSLECFAHLFPFVKWEDEEPYLIEDLLKEEENDTN